MNKKILIIGLKGLIGSNLFNYFKIKKLNVYQLSFENFIKNKNIHVDKFDVIINCTSNQKFIKNQYQDKNDNDLRIARKILHSKTKLVMLSTRKVYKAKFNIDELDKEKPNCNYSKNKIKSEINIKKILTNRVLILRISNIISYPNINKRKLHKTFSDIFFEMAKKASFIRTIKHTKTSFLLKNLIK